MTKLTPAQRRILDSTLERAREPLGFTRPSFAPSTMPDPDNPDRDEADINAMLDLLDKGEVSVLALCDCTKRSLQSLADLLESEVCQRAFDNFERIYQARHRLVELRKKFVADAALVRIAAASPLSHREAECVRKSANKLFEEHRRKIEHPAPAPVGPTSSRPPLPPVARLGGAEPGLPDPDHLLPPSVAPPLRRSVASSLPISLPILDLPTPANKQSRRPRTGPESALTSLLTRTGSATPPPAAPTPAASAARSAWADTTPAGPAASRAPRDRDDRHSRTMELASSP